MDGSDISRSIYEDKMSEAEAMDRTAYPNEITPALREVLGTMCFHFQCIHVAAVLRADGQQIARRAEDEQAEAA